MMRGIIRKASTKELCFQMVVLRLDLRVSSQGGLPRSPVGKNWPAAGPVSISNKTLEKGNYNHSSNAVIKPLTLR